MAKSSKSSKDATAVDPSAPAANPNLDATSSENPTARKTGKAPVKRASGSARKSAPGTKTKKTAARKKTKPVEFLISDEDIRLRAYFIAQHRALSGLNGDSASDWLEARRQLFDEASKPA